MISYIKGKVEIKASNYIVIEVNGIGYKIFMPETTIQTLENEQDIKVHTFLRVSQDDISLYGFLTNEELVMFELLIGVGGIGAKSATSILSNIEPSKFALAVITDDVQTLKKLPGIGVKTAQRIILELKDKIKTESAITQNEKVEEKIEIDSKAKDAEDALQVLGYNRKEIEKSLEKINTKDLELEDIIKQGLKLLGR